MIHPDSRAIEWIRQVSVENNIPDIGLVEKTIRAFSLLESLVRSGCPLIFKGGSSTLLLFNEVRRVSIDVDIICPPGTRIEDYIEKYSGEYGFGKVELIERISRINVPKQHAKFFYRVSYSSLHEENSVLLDVLFEDNHYRNVVELPLRHRFLKNYGDPVMVRIPSSDDLLGDKLTAFAPHTTGIPYFKGERNCAMEINKQLFDIAALFDIMTDFTITKKTFRAFAAVELQYRKLDPADLQIVLDDIYNTAVCIVLRGRARQEEFDLLKDGIKRIRGFIQGGTYTIEQAIVNASKAAYLAKLIENDCFEAHHFGPEAIPLLEDKILQAPIPLVFNKLKKTNIEAFFYWNEINEMI